MHKPCISIVSKRADVPSWGRALTLAGMYIYASNHPVHYPKHDLTKVLWGFVEFAANTRASVVLLLWCT